MSFDDNYLDPIDERVVPLALAIGQVVLGAAALEKVLLVDIAMRSVDRDGMRADLGRELSKLERRPAGALLTRLRELAIPDALADRIQDVIDRRNALVHRFHEDTALMIALGTAEDVDRAAERVQQIAIDCQQIINELIAVSFTRLEGALGMKLPEIVQWLESIDLDTITNPRDRAQLESIRAMAAYLPCAPRTGSGGNERGQEEVSRGGS